MAATGQRRPCRISESERPRISLAAATAYGVVEEPRWITPWQWAWRSNGRSMVQIMVMVAEWSQRWHGDNPEQDPK